MFFVRTSPNPKEMPLRKSVEISSDQAVFVPIISTAMNTNDSPDLNTESKRRAEANRYTDDVDRPPGPQNVTIDGEPLIEDNLKEFRVESPEFDLTVDDQCPIRNKLEVIYPPGTFPTVAAGYCIIIKSLPKREKPYTIHIRGDGKDGYKTEAIYELQVSDRK